MTNILVPTDFTPASLRLAEGALKSGNYDKCNLVLFHAFDLPSFGFDVLVGGSKDPSIELITESFRLACKQLKADYAKKVNKVIVRCMTGNTRALFRNFIEANDIDLIYCPETYFFRPAHTRSIDVLYLFKKCGVPVIKNNVRKPEPIVDPAYFAVVPISAQ